MNITKTKQTLGAILLGWLILVNPLNATEGGNLILGDYLTTQDLGSDSGRISDIWGYYTIEANGDTAEYAIVGLKKHGTSIVKVTNPFNLREDVPIRINNPYEEDYSYDVKMYGEYLYIANEVKNNVFIYTLSDPINPSLVGSILVGDDSEDTLMAVHNIYIDDTTGTLFLITGIINDSLFNIRRRGVFIYDISQDPSQPEFINSWHFSSTYGSHPHDLFIRDNRAFLAHLDAGLLVFDFDENYNIDTAEVRQHIYSWGRNNCNTDYRRTHSIWLSDDGNYAFTTDENERDSIYSQNPAAILRVWDISDSVDTPYTMVQFYDVPENSEKGIIGVNCEEIPNIPVGTPNNSAHNVLLKDGLAYISYYSKGLRVLDVSDPTQIEEIGYYDTPGFVNSALDSFGTWGVYPFLPSGNVVTSDKDGLRTFIGTPFARTFPLDISSSAMNGNPVQGEFQFNSLTHPVNEHPTNETFTGNWAGDVFEYSSYDLIASENAGDRFFHDWNGDLSSLQPAYSFTVNEPLETIEAHYKEKSPVNVMSSHPAVLRYLDPWLSDPDPDPTDWPLVTNDLILFLNESESPYSIYAPPAIQSVDGFPLFFAGFGANSNDVTLSEYIPPLIFPNIKNADFHVPNATLTANYRPMDGLTGLRYTPFLLKKWGKQKIPSPKSPEYGDEITRRGF